MRTIQVTVTHHLGNMDLELSTEVIVADDADAKDAGRDAGHVLLQLLEGYGEGAAAEPEWNP